jgi:hypothetical protein
MSDEDRKYTATTTSVGMQQKQATKMKVHPTTNRRRPKIIK